MLTVTVRHNGSHGLYLDHDGSVQVVSATLSHNGGYGVFTTHEDNALALENSVVQGNDVAARLAANALLTDSTWVENYRQEIEWLGGTLEGDHTWSSDLVDAYVVLGDVVVGSSAALTLTPGTEVRFNPAYLTAYGRLSAVGTADAPINLEPADKETTRYGVRIGGSEGNSDASHLGAGYAEIIDPAHAERGEQNFCIEISDICIDIGVWGACIGGIHKCGYFNPEWKITYYDDPWDFNAVQFGSMLFEIFGWHIPMEGFIKLMGAYGHLLAGETPPPDADTYKNPSWPYPVGYFDNPGN